MQRAGLVRIDGRRGNDRGRPSSVRGSLEAEAPSQCRGRSWCSRRRQMRLGATICDPAVDEVTLPAASLGDNRDGTPLVSVVLATYNRVKVLEDTLRMVLAQTFDDFELIVCDDGSTDGTPALMAEWARRDARVRYVRQPRNLGGWPPNVRSGIALAQAEFVAVLYDGDVYDPRLLERWLAALQAHPEAAFVFNAYNRLGVDGRIEKTYRVHLDSCVPGRVLLGLYFRRWHFTSPVWGTVMLRKSKYLAAGGLDIRFWFFADAELYLRLAETNCVAYIPEPLIGLASRETVPKLFRPPPKQLARQLFREARMRHYRGRPLRLIAEMLRHWTFVAVDVVVGPILTAVSGWQRPSLASRLRRRLIRRRNPAYMVPVAERPE
jgi:glycosyltransferase involved in cell wall biosynthesis